MASGSSSTSTYSPILGVDGVVSMDPVRWDRSPGGGDSSCQTSDRPFGSLTEPENDARKVTESTRVTCSTEYQRGLPNWPDFPSWDLEIPMKSAPFSLTKATASNRPRLWSNTDPECIGTKYTFWDESE